MIKLTKMPDHTVLQKLLTYDRDKGKLFWKTRPVEFFSTERACKAWNTQHAGKEAFTEVHWDGSRRGKIFGVNYAAHRIIIKMMTGEAPTKVQHVNGNPGDNRWSNLRVVVSPSSPISREKTGANEP